MTRRRVLVGAEINPSGGVDFRVWAPRSRSVEVICEDGPTVVLDAEAEGYFSGLVESAGVGTRYRYRLDDGQTYPDPASRYQPEGPHGPSEVVDPDAYTWADTDWRGRSLKGQVIYELHIGTFTPEGTFAAAAEQLAELANCGITVLEIMPISEFAGEFGWGYDGVDLYAPYHQYGTPDDLRRFVDRAHAVGIAVILDVVYNHLGPDGCYHAAYSDTYFSARHNTDWGQAINFDGPGSGPVREFFASNAAYWIDEFHFDGLRLDATQNIYDDSENHILKEIERRVRLAARGRATILVNENEPQHTHLIRPVGEGGYGLDGLWNDDFHHSAVVALTGRNEAYYTDHMGRPQEFVAAAKFGYLYQGQWYSWQKQRRGTPTTGLPPEAFVNFMENHDQLANSGAGRRMHTLTSPGKHRAMTALLLLGPGTPMLFQGQEFSASTPFLYFADHEPQLAKQVAQGRAEFLAQFPSMATPEIQQRLVLPHLREMFHRCKLDFSEREKHAEAYALHQDLLRLRREDPVLSALKPGTVDGAVLSNDAFVLRFFGEAGNDRLLLVNFGVDLPLCPAPEPLLAPPANRCWRLRWSSEDPRYGGHGISVLSDDAPWRLPGSAAVFLISEDVSELAEATTGHATGQMD